MPYAVVISLVLVVSVLGAPASGITPVVQAGSFQADEGCRQRLPLDRALLAETAGPAPVGVMVPCPGVRPGAPGWIDGTGRCTMNFLFRGTSYDEDGRPIDEGLFIGTAGHCPLDGVGEQRWAVGAGSRVEDAFDKRIGELAYAVWGHPQGLPQDVWLDFALIRIDDDREGGASAGLCHFGGPTGISSTWNEGDLVHHFGQGNYYMNTVQGRSGIVASGDQIEYSDSIVLFIGSVTGGDSGSPLIESDGDALGVIVGVFPVFGGPLVAATLLGPGVERAEAEMAMDLELVEAPFV